MTTPLSSTAPAATTGATPASAGSPAEQAKLKKVAQQFEAVFLRQMIGSMRSASLGDGIFDSSATEQFRDMSDAKMADQMAGQGALHIADLLVKQFGARLSGSAAGANPLKMADPNQIGTAVQAADTAALAGAATTKGTGQ